MVFNIKTVVSKYLLCCIALMLLMTARAGAQEGYNERAKKYVEQYYRFAIIEQKNYGIPASVTLGQGILETEAGASELMVRGKPLPAAVAKMPFVPHTYRR